jgi:uncharacterized BrkB/YihY/UPF0761 family membrane protein
MSMIAGATVVFLMMFVVLPIMMFFIGMAVTVLYHSISTWHLLTRPIDAYFGFLSACTKAGESVVNAPWKELFTLREKQS